MKQLFFLHGELIHEQPARRHHIHAELAYPTGKAFFCPLCSEVWAVSAVETRETYTQHVLCERHEATPTRPVPGSLWLPWDRDWNESLPQQLLEREFLLLTQGQ